MTIFATFNIAVQQISDPQGTSYILRSAQLIVYVNDVLYRYT